MKLKIALFILLFSFSLFAQENNQIELSLGASYGIFVIGSDNIYNENYLHSSFEEKPIGFVFYSEVLIPTSIKNINYLFGGLIYLQDDSETYYYGENYTYDHQSYTELGGGAIYAGINGQVGSNYLGLYTNIVLGYFLSIGNMESSSWNSEETFDYNIPINSLNIGGKFTWGIYVRINKIILKPSVSSMFFGKEKFSIEFAGLNFMIGMEW